MEELEYNERLKQIETDYDNAKKKLYLDYAMSKVIFKKGDIIKDSRCFMLIDKITVSKSFGLPEPVYTGVELTKDLKPRKNGSRVSIFGNNAELIKLTEIKKDERQTT